MKKLFTFLFCLFISDVLFAAADKGYCLNFDPGIYNDSSTWTYTINYIIDKKIVPSCCNQTMPKVAISSTNGAPMCLDAKTRTCSAGGLLMDSGVKTRFLNKICGWNAQKRGACSILIGKQMKFYQNADCNTADNYVEVDLQKGYRPIKLKGSGFSYKLPLSGGPLVFSFQNIPIKKDKMAKDEMPIATFLVLDQPKTLKIKPPKSECLEAITEPKSGDVDDEDASDNNYPVIGSCSLPEAIKTAKEIEAKAEADAPLADFYKKAITPTKENKGAVVLNAAYVFPCTINKVADKELYGWRNLHLLTLVGDTKDEMGDHTMRFKGVKHGNYTGMTLFEPQSCDQSHCGAGGFDGTCSFGAK